MSKRRTSTVTIKLGKDGTITSVRGGGAGALPIASDYAKTFRDIAASQNAPGKAGDAKDPPA